MKININNIEVDGKLFLEIEEIDFVQQSEIYYWVIDDYLDEEESLLRGVKGLKRVLTSWISLIKSSTEGAITFLPFDFSDQYIGLIKLVYLAEDNVKLEYGYTTEYEGSEISPSNWANNYVNLGKSFEGDKQSFLTQKDLLIKDISESLKHINEKIKVLSKYDSLNYGMN